MITTAFLAILNSFLELLVAVFPQGDGFPNEVHQGATLVGGYVRTLDPLLPVDTLFQILVLVVAVEIAILSFKSFKWLISHIPFVGGKG